MPPSRATSTWPSPSSRARRRLPRSARCKFGKSRTEPGSCWRGRGSGCRRKAEGRPGCAGASPSAGGLGGPSRPPMSPKGRHHLRREALELLEDHRLRRADRLTDVDDLQAGVLVLDLHELRGEEPARARLVWVDMPGDPAQCSSPGRAASRANEKEITMVITLSHGGPTIYRSA